MYEQIPILVVCGPTASGKTRLAVDLAKEFNGEVVGADSMQVYKYMNIGTAKPDASEMRGIPHHLIDFIDPGEDFSVARYLKLAKAVIADINNRGKLPVLSGGTGLYISSLIDNIIFEGIADSGEIREGLKVLAHEKGAEYLHDELKKCDPALAEKLHPNNLGRVIRALEVFKLTGITMSEHQRKARQNSPEYNSCIIGICYSDRQKLYDRINLRVDRMLEQGLAQEAKSLFDAGFTGTSVQAIGYKELERYFYGMETLEEAAENIKRETRRYAKRQMTWFKRDKRIRWICADEFNDYDEIKRTAFKIAETFLT